MFKITDAHQRWIKAAIKQHGKVYVHGDGQVYTDPIKSKDHVDFSHPENEAAGYVVEYTTVEQVPDSIDGFQKDFFASKQKQTLIEKTINQKTYGNVITFDDDDVKADEPESEKSQKKTKKVPEKADETE